MTGDLLIITAIASQQTRDRFEPMLRSIDSGAGFLATLAFKSRQLQFTDDLDLAISHLEDHFRTAATPVAIVISDQLLDCGGILAPNGSRAPSLEAMEKLDPHYLAPHGTIAVTTDGRRIANIDRVLCEQRTCLEELKKCVELVADRVVYLLRPTPVTSTKPIRVRRIKDELELRDYYRLRHRIYRMMGYMSTQKEDVPSEMEIDGCDSAALHFGAFELQSGFESLIGTTRIVFMDSDETTAVSRGGRWTSKLLEGDPQLKVLVLREQLPNGLPVFHSQNLNDHLHEALERKLNCAELSRVIVHPDYRGVKLSAKLVENAVNEAQANHVDRMYLECLDVHEPLYAHHGFKSIPNTRGVVVGVGRTMIAMMRDFHE